MADPEGVSLVFGDTSIFNATPTWTRIDDTDNLVGGWSSRRGRSAETDEMETGKGSIRVNDKEGVLDSTNTLGPNFGFIDPRIQAALCLRNPITDTWATIFRGFVEQFDYEPARSRALTRPTIDLVDGAALLAEMEMFPGGFGDTPPIGYSKAVFFENALVDDRIKQILTNAGWPLGLREIFSGNVRVKDTVYSAGESALAAIQEAADAEFPGVANRYISKDGLFTFHGRLARFNPSDVSYHITTWKAGDGAAVEADPTHTAHIRGLNFSRGFDKIINAAMCYPQGFRETATLSMTDQIVIDGTSIDQFGYSPWSAENLIIFESILTGNDANEECAMFAQYYVDNYKNPRDRINQLIFKSMRPEDPRAPKTWQLLTEIELNDIVEVTCALPGGGGFTEEPFFVEGLTYEVTPLNPDYPMVTLTVDLSPQAWFPAGYWT